MTEPTASVVIPAFNASAYIVDAITSVLCQSFRDLEVVVIDDGSTDKTAELVGQIKDSRIRLIQQDNLGQSVAINTGVECSRGAYIKLLDADDWINPAHLESQLNAIDGAQNLLASCRWGYFVEDHVKSTIQEEFTQKNYDSSLEWLVDSLTRDKGMMGGWMWLIPRSLWDKAGGFDPRLSLNNDFHFSIKLLLASDGVRFAKDAVYSYRKGIVNALSGSSGRRAMESAFLTTELGARLLLTCEESPRIRKICADRFQQWLYRFYPQYPDLAFRTEQRIEELGGSDLEMQGGMVLRILKPLIGWKMVRRLQSLVYRYGWNKVLERKAANRMKALSRET